MKANMMRTPLIKSAVVLLVFALLAYFTSASPEGSVLNSVSLIIIGMFRLIQWAIAMIIGLTVSIAVLIGIFLLCVAMVSRENAARMFQNVKRSVADLLAPVSCYVAALRGKESPCAVSQSPQPSTLAADQDVSVEAPPVAEPEAPPAAAEVVPPVDVAGEIKTIAENQQQLSQQIAALNAQIAALEEKSSTFAAAGQMESIAGEITASTKAMEAVHASVTAMEGKITETPSFDPQPLNDAVEVLNTRITALENKITETVQQVQALSADTLLGDLPARLEKLEKTEVPSFDPKPLADTIENLSAKLTTLEKQSSGFVVSGQLESLRGELTASTQSLATVQESMAALEGTITETAATLRNEMEELKKKPQPPTRAKTTPRAKKKT